MRNSKELLLASRQFAHEKRWLSWWHLGSTIAVLVSLMMIACCDLPWLVRLPFSILAGLVVMRFFVLFHDQQHGAILRRSKLAEVIMWIFGMLTLNPTSVWRRSHDHHHRNNSRSFTPNVGSYPLLTVEAYENASFWERVHYAASRHYLTMALGYLTVFLFGMCIQPLLANPRRHFDAALSILIHVGFLYFVFDEFDDLWLAGIIPCAIGSASGSYLFFAQHNFPGVKLQTEGKWDYVYAALHSSSYIEMGPMMRWLTANIGYHHIHHLNSKIPFYRLPEAMNALEELKSPPTTSLRPRDILACLRLKLWDPEAGKLVPWPRPASRPVPIMAATTGLANHPHAAEISSHSRVA